MKRRKTNGAIAALASLILAAGTAIIGQTVDVAGKISAGVQQALADGATTLPVFIELASQPQAEILQRMEAGNSRLVLAKSTFERSASNRAIVVAKDLEAAQDELDAAIGGVRHEAAQAIQDEIRPEQDNVSAALAGLGATDIQRYFIVNVLRADVPASAVAVVANRPEVVRISLVGSGSVGADTAAALGAPAFWDATPKPFTGGGQTVAVLDTGINEKHPAFKNVRFVDGVFLRNAHAAAILMAAAHQVDGCGWGEAATPTSEDLRGHGTLVADAAAGEGVASNWFGQPDPNVVRERGIAFGIKTILNVKVIHRCTDGTGRYNSADVLEGLQFAAFPPSIPPIPPIPPASIVNLSLFSGDRSYSSLAQYIDRIVDLSSNLVVTTIAGNCGLPDPKRCAISGAGSLNEPGTAYNAITVGGEHYNEIPLSNLHLTIWQGSSQGPTLDERRKPDIMAPADGLLLANNNWGPWGPQPYLADQKGTSFAAPQVAGAAALLLDLGVPSAVAVKALLINSAVIDPNAAKQFNDSLSPWNARRGWGYMRLGTLPGLLQRTDGKEVCESSLPANPYPSACVLGSLAKKDEVNFYEGSIDGPFKATLVWNRHFTNAVLALDPLELSLYHKQGQTFAKIVVNNDKTLNGNTPKDNVQQVEVTEKNDVLVKVKLPADLVTGVTQERYGLAFSMALKPVAKPSLGVSCVVPPNPPSLQKVAVTCSASNAGGLPVFGAAASSSSGTASPVTLGTISAGGNATFTVNLTAPAVSDPALSVIVKVSGSLAGDSYTASGAFTLAPTATDCPIPITSLATPITLPAAGGTYSDSVTGLPSGCKWLVRVDSGTNFLSVAWSGMPTAAPGAFTFTAVPNGTLQIRGGVIEVWAVNNLNNPSESAFIFIAQEFQAGLGVAR